MNPATDFWVNDDEYARARQSIPTWCLDGLVCAQAERTPDAVALEQGADRLSYRQLVDRAEAFAAELHAAEVGPGDRVGLGLERTLSLPVALLAVLRAGAAYVPLDPAYPEARLTLMLDDASVRALVAEPGSELAALAPKGCPVLAPRGDGASPSPLTGGTLYNNAEREGN